MGSTSPILRERIDVWSIREEIRKIYANFGIQLEELNEGSGDEVPIPATYIVDRDFTIRYAHASADITDRAEPEFLLERLSLITPAQ